MNASIPQPQSSLEKLKQFALKIPAITSELSQLEKEKNPEILNEKIHKILGSYDFEGLIHNAEDLAKNSIGMKWIETMQSLAYVGAYADPEFYIDPEMNPLAELIGALQKIPAEIEQEK